MNRQNLAQGQSQSSELSHPGNYSSLQPLKEGYTQLSLQSAFNPSSSVPGWLRWNVFTCVGRQVTLHVIRTTGDFQMAG